MIQGILVDENVPFLQQLPTTIKIIGTRALGDRPTDTEVWEYARQQNLVILTKDADFFNRIIVSEPPPKVVHLKVANMRKSEFQHFLTQTWPKIEYLLQKHKLVKVYNDHLVGI